jgi:hypothetical protein
MATNWTTQNKASSTDNWSTERISRTLSNLYWDDISENWEDITTLYYDWTTWTFSGKAITRDTD